MKKLSSTIILIITMLVSLHMNSQNTQRLPALRDRIAQAKLQEIKKNLNLDQATFSQFRPIFLKYEREKTRIDFKNKVRLMKVNADSLSYEEADQLISNQFKKAKRLVFIREKYYQEFRKILTPQQLIKLYQTEAGIVEKVTAERMKRIKNR